TGNVLASKQIARRGDEQPEPQDEDEHREGVHDEAGESGLSEEHGSPSDSGLVPPRIVQRTAAGTLTGHPRTVPGVPIHRGNRDMRRCSFCDSTFGIYARPATRSSCPTILSIVDVEGECHDSPDIFHPASAGVRAIRGMAPLAQSRL